MIEKRPNSLGFGLYATCAIPGGTLLFTEDEWIQDEMAGWDLLTIDTFLRLPDKERGLFMQYAYSKNFDTLIGTFDWSRATHASNFINHSCAPTLIYDREDTIIAARDIARGEQLTLDYGVVIVNIDQPFTCACGDRHCRTHLLRDDWKFLVKKYGYHVPAFMHGEVKRILSQGGSRD